LKATLRTVQLLLFAALAFAGAAMGVADGPSPLAFYGARAAAPSASLIEKAGGGAEVEHGVAQAHHAAPSLHAPRQGSASGRTPPRPHHPNPVPALHAQAAAEPRSAFPLSRSNPEFSRALQAMRDGTVSSFSNGVPPPALA
jgi:hypothetical protein